MKKILILLLLILPAAWALFQPGFFPSHDGEWMVIRLADFHRSLVAGQIPVRWAARLNFSYGYPIFNFLYPLSFYLGEFFYFFSGSFINSIKLVFVVSFFFSGLFMFLWTRKIWGDWGGLVAAVFYVYAPYRFFDVYVRGSIGEAVSFVFLPLIFWSVYELSQKRRWSFIALGALAYAGLVMSHNIIAMVFTYVLAAYVLFLWFFSRRRKTFFFDCFSLFGLGLGLSCFFWLPALYDKQFTVLDQVTVAKFWEHFPTLNQLLVPAWGYGPSIPGSSDTNSYQIGPLHLLAIFAGLIAWYRLKKTAKKRRSLILFFLLIFGLFFLLMLAPSTFIWQIAPMFWRIQFPWRLLSVTTLASAFLAGAAVFFTQGWKIPLAIGSIGALILLSRPYAQPESIVDRGEGFYATNEATTTVKDEYLPIWVKEKPVERAATKVAIVKGEGEVLNLAFNSKKTNFDLEATTELEVQINTVYFPGWQVKSNGRILPLNYQNERGLIIIKVPSGRHQVVAEFGETPLRLTADLVSLASLVLVGGGLIRQRKKR